MIDEIPQIMALLYDDCIDSTIAYTLPQKKRTFNVPIFSGARGFMTLTQGPVNFVKWSCE